MPLWGGRAVRESREYVAPEEFLETVTNDESLVCVFSDSTKWTVPQIIVGDLRHWKFRKTRGKENTADKDGVDPKRARSSGESSKGTGPKGPSAAETQFTLH